MEYSMKKLMWLVHDHYNINVIFLSHVIQMYVSCICILNLYILCLTYYNYTDNKVPGGPLVILQINYYYVHTYLMYI